MPEGIPTVLLGVKPISSSNADKHTAGKTAVLIFWYYVFICVYHKAPFNYSWIKDAIKRWAEGDKHTFDFWNVKYQIKDWTLGENNLWPDASPHIVLWYKRQAKKYDWDVSGGKGFLDKDTGEQIDFWNWEKIEFDNGVMIESETYISTYRLDQNNTLVEKDFDTTNDRIILEIPTNEIPEFELEFEILETSQIIDNTFLSFFENLFNWFLEIFNRFINQFSLPNNETMKG